MSWNLLKSDRVVKMTRWVKRSLANPTLRQTPTLDAQYRTWEEGPPAGGKVANIIDLTNPNFGAAYLRRFSEGTAHLPPRKVWELAWLAQRFEDLKIDGGSILGLGVGREPLIYHFAHRAQEVVATDLYSLDTAWREARLGVESVYQASPFPYPQERLTVQNMDMRKLEFPSERFDAVWSCSSVEHVQTIPQLVQIFREIHRVLKTGGVALITTEFSLGDPYFLPGVLSLWKDCDLFTKELSGLTLLGPVDLTHHDEIAGNLPTARRDVHRFTIHQDYEGGPTGLCLNVGYTKTIPIALAFRKTGPTFDWPEHLGAPAWYVPYAAGIEVFADKSQAAQAADHFRAALALADTPGARLHCFRSLIEAHVHGQQIEALHETLAQCQKAAHEFPADDDALDLIAYIAAGAGYLPFARRCWEKAYASPSALPSTRLRIRVNHLEAELKEHGLSGEAKHLYYLAEAAWLEALDFLGAEDILLKQLGDRLQAARQQYQIAVAIPTLASTAAPVSITSANAPITIRNPNFNMAAPPIRPMVYVGDHLALTKTVYGHKMFVDSRTQMGACFLLDGFWEEWITRHLATWVKPGMRVLDIGANMGFYTLLLADLVGPQGNVIAFEAQPEILDILYRNVQLNGFQERTKLVQKVIHASERTFNFASFDRYGTGAVNYDGLQESLEAIGFRDKPVLMELPGTSLDKFFEGQTPDIDFIKIDADGSEPFIFRGMQSFLRSDRPLTILCEYCPPLYHQDSISPMQFLEEIQAANFRISAIMPEGIQPVESLTKLTELPWAELLLVRDGN